MSRQVEGLSPKSIELLNQIAEELAGLRADLDATLESLEQHPKAPTPRKRATKKGAKPVPDRGAALTN